MAELNWHAKIYRHRGSFLHKADLEEHSHVHRLLAGAEPWEEAWSDGELDNPLYQQQIQDIRQHWHATQTEQQKQQNDIKDLTEKVAQRLTEKQWVASFLPPRDFPRRSAWSAEQQRFVVDMLVRYWATGVPAHPAAAEASHVRRLLSFIGKMREEQEEYFQFAKEVNATQLPRYNYINPFIDKYIHSSMENKIRRLKSEYPCHYQQLSMLPLAPPVDEAPNFYPLSEPLELGEVPVCVIPDMRKYTDVKRQTVFLKQFFPPDDYYPKSRSKGYVPRDGTYLYKTPVSADPNMALLSRQQQFDVVATPSVLKTLLDNSAPLWDRQWEVPVTVRLEPDTQAGTYRRVVFLDKPLPPRSLNNIERNARAHKRTVRILVCKRVTGPGPVDYSIWANQPDRRETQSFKEKVTEKKKKKGKKKKRKLQEQQRQDQPQKKQKQSSGLPPEDGAGLVSELAADRQSVHEPDTDSESSDSDGAELQIDCDQEEQQEQQEEHREPEEERQELEEPEEERQELEEPEEEPERMEESPVTGTQPERMEEGPTTGTQPAADGPSPEPRRLSDAGHGQTDTDGSGAAAAAAAAAAGQQWRQDGAHPAFVRPPPGLNVHYRVWQLGGLRLLLRAATHGMRDNPTVGRIRYTVHAKPAYQPGLGIEVLTRPEAVSQWLDCLVRPDSRVIRVHLDPISQMVITPEERTLRQLTEELIKYDTGFKPQYGLQVLESVLQQLTSLQPGQYLLSHDGRTGPFVRLSRAADRSAPGGSNLHQSFPQCPAQVELESPRGLSIDPSVLTPYNTKYGRVPATFPYRRQIVLGEGGWKEHWSKLKEQGITRKKKKKNVKAKQETSSEAEEAAPVARTRHLS